MLANNLIALCARGGFRLTKWVSRSNALLLSLPEGDCAKKVKDLDLDEDIMSVERALGVQWCIETDSFECLDGMKGYLNVSNRHGSSG